MYKWPLQTDNFTWWNRLKICSFILNPKNYWTQNIKVQEFENKMAKFIGVKHTLFCSSGSTANTILAMYLKNLKKNTEQNIVIFPSTTWITSVSPFIREGFKPHFIDINLSDLSMNLDKLEQFIQRNRKNIACIFITSLLGFVPDMDRLQKISLKYNARIWMDNCEAHFGKWQNKNISSIFTSTTSTYTGHMINSVEGGFIFTNEDYQYQQFLMLRNHGMVRSLNILGDCIKNIYSNILVDKRFDFHLLGNNFRNNDILSFIGLLDFQNVEKYIQKRKEIYRFYQSILDTEKFLIPKNNGNSLEKEIPFCLPVIFKKNQPKNKIKEILLWCENNSIETRPIVSGFLGYQSAVRNYFNNWKNYPNSIHIHNNSFYVGLPYKLKEKQVLKLVNFLNNI